MNEYLCSHRRREALLFDARLKEHARRCQSNRHLPSTNLLLHAPTPLQVLEDYYEVDLTKELAEHTVGEFHVGEEVGRLASDYTKNILCLPRSYCISLVYTLFIISQAVAFSTDDITQLWKASLALGLAYGGLSGLFPSITIDWFGLSHFSETWGIVCLSPFIGGNLFSIAFGRNLDAHTPSSSDTPPTAPFLDAAISEPQCLEGRACYAASLQMTTAACCLALALGIWAAQRDRMKAAALAEIARKPTVDWNEQN
ncbi:hypothetical protein FIBSPDRAFT_1045810 [Athelia psychrophila]|uniref:MFS general substrate transporter n=1 Tax=Athelia psychrophila TaxID=1759441 RepID=A0A166HP63_9AGAM|nr:hypothetical protein FIBSPDRAFT_1045810 [Fibularhizoctonia sp. CBS 109695]